MLNDGRSAPPWYQESYQTIAIRFGDTKENTDRGLGKVIRFLGKEATQNGIEKSIEVASLNRARRQVEDQKLASQFYRKGKSGEGKKFTFDEKREVLRRTGPVLKHAGYNVDIEPTDEMS